MSVAEEIPHRGSPSRPGRVSFARMDLSVLLGAAAMCAAGGVFPWISSEVVLVGAAALLPATQFPTLVILCALTQVAGKCVVYGITRWTPEKLPKRARKLLDKAEAWRDRRKLLGAGVLSSATVSVPPFYVVTLAAGMLKVPFVVFTGAALVGTVVRYSAVVWLAVRAGVGG